MLESDWRYGHLYGHGSLVEVPNPNLVDSVLFNQALEYAWSNGCSIPEEIIAQRGAYESSSRYQQLNRWFSQLVSAAGDKNPALYYQLITPFARKDKEIAGVYEDDHVPPSYRDYMAPMCTHAGFATSRLIVEIVGRPNGHTGDDLNRLILGDQVISRVIFGSGGKDEVPPKTLGELPLRAALEAYQARVAEEKIIRHLFSAKFLSQEGTLSAYRDTAVRLFDELPELWRWYEDLPYEQREVLEIADPDEFLKSILSMPGISA